MFDEIIKYKKPIPQSLINYGFVYDGSCYLFRTEIRNGEFELTVIITDSGKVDTKLVEKNGEEYVLYKTSAVGSFVGEIRALINSVISDVVEKCFGLSVFKSRQSQTVIDFIRNKFGDEPEYLWEKFPNNAVFRRKENRKWYVAILTVEGNKLGLDSDAVEEIIDLRMNPTNAQELLARENYFPGWHMNKKSWYTLVLNESLPDDEIKQRITESYNLAKK